MQTSLREIIEKIDFPRLVQETHELDRTNKICCPIHSEKTPSCQINKEYFYCYGCNFSGDALTWLIHARGLSQAQAIAELKTRLGIPAYSEDYTKKFQKQPIKLEPLRKRKKTEPLTDEIIASHFQQSFELKSVPPQLKNRFTLEEMQELNLTSKAAYLLSNGAGEYSARKIRTNLDKPRYLVTHEKDGCKVWESFDWQKQKTIIICEGEINAKSLSLCLPYGVIGASTHSELESFKGSLKGKRVYLLTDKDEAGTKLRDEWKEVTQKLGAKTIHHAFYDDLYGNKKDPNDIKQEYGLKALSDLTNLNQATLMHYKQAEYITAYLNQNQPKQAQAFVPQIVVIG